MKQAEWSFFLLLIVTIITQVSALSTPGEGPGTSCTAWKGLLRTSWLPLGDVGEGHFPLTLLVLLAGPIIKMDITQFNRRKKQVQFIHGGSYRHGQSTLKLFR